MSKTTSALRALPKRGEIESSMSQFANRDGESCGVDAKRRAPPTLTRAHAGLRSACRISALRFDRGVETLFEKPHGLPRGGDDLVEDHGHLPTMWASFPCVDRSAYAA